MTALSGSRPYFVRAVYEWIVDQQLTPYLLVNSNWPGAELPFEFAQDGQLVLNVSPSAVRHLALGNDAILFSARFSGRPMDITVPMGAVLGIYTKEDGRGMFFDPAEYSPEPTPSPVTKPTSQDAPKKRPSLRVVK